MNAPYTLYYFDVRGRAEPIRLLLAYAKVQFEDRGVAGDAWAKLKPETPLGQMPVLVEHRSGGDRSIPQSMAIMRHLARVHGLDGKTEDERLDADVAAETAADARSAFAAIRYSAGWNDPAAKEKYTKETQPEHFRRLDKLLGERRWFAGSAPTWADLLAFDTLDRALFNFPGCLDSWPRLLAFAKRVEALPELENYLRNRRPAA